MITDLPELKIVEAYLQNLDFMFLSMKNNIDFRLFGSAFFCQFEAFENAYKQFKQEYVSQLKFKNYE